MYLKIDNKQLAKIKKKHEEVSIKSIEGAEDKLSTWEYVGMDAGIRFTLRELGIDIDSLLGK